MPNVARIIYSLKIPDPTLKDLWEFVSRGFQRIETKIGKYFDNFTINEKEK